MVFDDFREKFKLGPHYRIERFGVIFFSLLICLSLVLVTIMFKKSADDKHSMANNVVYTSSFSTSLTDNKGEVVDIYKSNDNTRAFILLKFDNMDTMSTDARNYQMFLTGSSMDLEPTDLVSQPKGMVYMFGSTSYMGIYFINSKGFDSQILNLTVRCNKELVVKDDSVSADDFDDGSFATYDQFRIYFNPGGTEYTEADCLTEGKLDAFSIYESLIVREQEKEVQTELDKALSEMHVLWGNMDEYERRLREREPETDRIVVPERPPIIAGDTFTVDTDGNISMYSSSTCNGGVNFNWRDGSLRTGYLDAVCNGKPYTQFFAEKEFERSNSSKELIIPESWQYALTGEEFTQGTDTISTNIQKDIELLTTTYRNYYNLKRKYQTDLLMDLLVLESDTKSVSANYTINDSGEVLTCY